MKIDWDLVRDPTWTWIFLFVLCVFERKNHISPKELGG